MRIGIIGGGATGTVVLRQLAEVIARAPGDFPVTEIVLLDKAGFDGGLPYRTRSEHHLFNMRAGTMSAVSNDDRHFVRWLQQNGQDCWGGEHFPRRLYRRYLDDLRDDAEARCEAARVRVRMMVGEAVQLRRAGASSFVLELAGGPSLTLGAAVLCTGHNAPEDHYNLANCRNFSLDPYAPLAIADEPGIRVGIIGTGLAAIDNAVALGHELRHVGITCLSRSGRFPKVQPLIPASINPAFREAVALHLRSETTIRADALARCIEAALRETAGLHLDFTAPGTAPDGIAQLEQDIGEAESGEANTFSYLAAITDLVCDAWRRMEQDEKARFMRETYSGWMRNRHAMPLVNARKLRAIAEAGRLRLASGLRGIVPDGDGFEAQLASDESAGFDFLISAAGPSYGLARSRLYADAARNGVLQLDPFGGVVCGHPDGRVQDGDGRPHRTLFAVGSPTRGSFFYAAAMDINVTRARAMAQSLLHGIVPQPAARPAVRPASQALPSLQSLPAQG